MPRLVCRLTAFVVVLVSLASNAWASTPEPLYQLELSKTYYFLTPSPVVAAKREKAGWHLISKKLKIDFGQNTGLPKLTKLYALGDVQTGDSYYTIDPADLVTYEHKGYTFNGAIGWVSSTATAGYTAFYRAFNPGKGQNAFGTLRQTKALDVTWTKYIKSPVWYTHR